MSTIPAFTMTHESITVVWEGKSHTVQRGAPQFLALKQAIVSEKWDDIPKNLTVKNSLETWAKGCFTLYGETFSYGGKALPALLNQRIVQMASNNEDPSPLFKFWERLQKNPSYRSVEQLWPFMAQRGIPLTKDGCFLAYKSVHANFKDFHTGTVDNTPGVINKMPRNQISDDPQKDCHDGFHVGALEYARSFGNSDRRIIICKVDPENVVCVPYDSSQQKMRVCEYKVVGNWNGEHMPATTIDPGDYGEGEGNEEIDVEKIPEDELKANSKRTSKKGFAKFDKMGLSELMLQSLDDLRQYAGKGLEIVGASKIPGGKTALVAKILEVRAS